MTVAITGGTGFVGQAVLDAAERQGLGVRALARTVPSDRPTVSWVQGSLSQGAALSQLVAKVDAIIHIAGLTNSPDAAKFASANVEGTRAMIAAAKDSGIKRFIFVSSLAARKPELSAYCASKLAAEKLVEASGLNWTIIRPPGVYGPRDVDYLDMFKAAKLGVVPLPPGGASSMIHVDDLAELLLVLVPASPKTRLAVYEPDDGRTGGWSHRELAATIGAAVGRKPLALHLPNWILETGARADRLLRGDRAKLTLDRVGYLVHPNWVSRFDKGVPRDLWTPKITTPKGLATTARWYREQGWL